MTPLRTDWRPQPASSERDGAAIDVARRRKRRQRPLPVSLQKSRLDCSRHVPIWRFRDVKGCGNRAGDFGSALKTADLS